MIFLNEHYSEECHKQWLALGLISELVPQVQTLPRLYQQTLHLDSIFEIKLNILYSLDQVNCLLQNEILPRNRNPF